MGVVQPVAKEERLAEKEEEWLLREITFLQKFENEITELFTLQQKLNVLQQVSPTGQKIKLLQELIEKDLKELPSVARKIGRTERRRVRYEKRVLGNIALLRKQLGQVNEQQLADIITQIQIYSGRVLSEVSLYVGKISEQMKRGQPNLPLIKKSGDIALQASTALIALLEQFKKLLDSAVDYHTNEDIPRIITTHNPLLRQKIIRGEAPLFYYHGTKPHLVEFILKSGILAPEMRLKIRDEEKFNIELMREVRLFMRIQRTPVKEQLRKEYLSIPSLLRDDQFEPITTATYFKSSTGGVLQEEMFPPTLWIKPRVFYPYFADDLAELLFQKYEKFYVQQLLPEQFEHLTRKINTLVEKRIVAIRELGEQKQIPPAIIEEYCELLRRAYAVIPHFEYLHGASFIREERTDRAGSSGSYRWIVRKDKWFVYFAADSPFKAFDTFSDLVHWFLNNNRACIFELKPTLYDKIAWSLMGVPPQEGGKMEPNLYTGRIHRDLVSTEIISLHQYCSRVYCRSQDVDFFKKLLKHFKLPISVHAVDDQKRIYQETFEALKG